MFRVFVLSDEKTCLPVCDDLCEQVPEAPSHSPRPAARGASWGPSPLWATLPSAVSPPVVSPSVLIITNGNKGAVQPG